MPFLLFGGFALASLLGIGSTVANSSEPSQGGGSAPRLPSYPPPPGEAAYYPQQQPATYGPEVRLAKQRNSHFYASVWLGGCAVRMLVDTGCTGMVVDRDIARALGVPLDRVAYDLPVHAGNATLYAHRFFIPEMTVEGGLTAQNVEAVVHQAHEDDGRNLLGMSFLGRFSVAIAGDEMIIRR